MKISDIKIGKRFRQDLGDIQKLAQSIKEIGLLHPVVVNENKELIAGRRRIAAYEILGYEDIDVTVVNLNDIQKAEISENTIRKNFTFEERAIIREEYKPQLEKEAKTRQGRSSPKLGEVSDILASYFGISHGTNDKEERIWEAVKNNPEFGNYVKKIDNDKMSVHKADRLIKHEQKKQELIKEMREHSQNLDWTNSDMIMVESSSGRMVVGFLKTKGVKLSDEEIAELKRQVDEKENRPAYWFLSEEERVKIIEHKEFKTKIINSGKQDFKKDYVSKKEIIDWLADVDESALYNIKLFFREKSPRTLIDNNPIWIY
jgi:ParB/Sulfiredoxin domain